MIVDEDKFLEHYGKKGMKWGVRKVYAEKTQKKIDRFERVDKGTANKRDRFRSAAQTSGLEKAVAANRGQSVAGMKAKALKEHIDRIEKGEARSIDMMAMYGSLTIVDLGRGVRRRNG